mgnify:CR=1 FL=1
MTKAEFDAVIHAPNRLQICALLETTKELEFQIIKEQLDVSDSVLSKHLKILDDANYVQLIKKTEFTRQRTWISLTSGGRKAFKSHLKELRRIVGKI